MKTVQISNGDFNVTDGSGSLVYIDGIAKGSQDVGRAVLTEFSSFFQEGCELITMAAGSTPTFMTEGLVTQFLTEAVNRIIVKQQTSEGDDRILKVNQVKTRVVGLSTVVFMLEVLFASGDSSSIISKISLKPLALDHLLSPDNFVTI